MIRADKDEEEDTENKQKIAIEQSFSIVAASIAEFYPLCTPINCGMNLNEFPASGESSLLVLLNGFPLAFF